MARMNEMWRRMTFAVVLCVLLVQRCQGEDALESTQPTSSPQTAGSVLSNSNLTATPNTTAANTSTTKPTDSTGKTSTTPATKPTENSQSRTFSVTCVETEPDNSRDRIILKLNTSSNCSVTSDLIREKMNESCPYKDCKLEIFQEADSENVVLTGAAVEGNLGEMENRINALQDLGVENIVLEPKKTSPAMLASLLGAGLLLAAALIGIYLRRNRSTNGKDMKLANESVMAGEENQGNTLVSVAPLNPPEPQEKPSQNGESPEAVKTQNPPAATNGHSATKTADTEL